MSFRKRFLASSGKDTFGSKKRKRGVTVFGYEVGNPIHFHCGPGNEVREEKSENVVDENCRQHDIMYSKMEVDNPSLDPKFFSSAADQRFVRDQLRTGTLAGAVYALPFMLKGAIAPRWPEKVESFSKKLQRTKMVLQRRRVRRGRRRRRSRAMKRLTRLQIYKAIGNRIENRHEAFYNLLGAYREGASSTSSSNNSFLYHICTLNDQAHYQEVAGTLANNAGVVFNPQDATQDAPYFTRAYGKCLLTNMSNINLVLQPVRVILGNDLYNENSSTSYSDNRCAYTWLSNFKVMATKTSVAGTYDRLQVIVPTTTHASPFSPTGMEFPTNTPLPFHAMRKLDNIKVGRPFVLPVQGSITVNLKGRKGVIPQPQMWASTASSGLSGATPRVPVGFRKRTVMYFYIIRPQSHVVSDVGSGVDANEAYIGGPWRIAMDFLRVTKAVGIPMDPAAGYGAGSSGRVIFDDQRPLIDATATKVRAMVDTSETGSDVTSLVT